MTERMRPRAGICTLGCKVNQYESDAVAAELEALGFEIADFSDICDVYVVNTCAVTGESERKSRQMIRRAAARNPRAFVLVAGCFSQIQEEEARIPGVDYVCGNRNKSSVAETAARLVADGVKGNIVSSVLDLETAPFERMARPLRRRTRAYIKIEDGCDNHCTYCIIKKARGGVVSRPPEEVISEIRAFAALGCAEVILTGVEAASYGRDIGGYSLSRLLAEAARVEGIRRVRAGSLEPSVLTRAFCDELAAEPHIMPSFHLSLQSGSDAVLSAMKRRYNRRQVLESVSYLRAVMPGATFTCDVIVGFPGETEVDFLDTVDLAEKIGFLHMHIFPFSPREGTPAAEMAGQISEQVKQERLHRLEAVGARLAEKLYRAAVGGVRHVLFESRHGAYLSGHTEDMLEVKLKTDEPLSGEIRAVRLVSFDGTALLAELLSEEL